MPWKEGQSSLLAGVQTNEIDDSFVKIQPTNLTGEFVPGVLRTVCVVARADAAVVAVAGGAVVAGVVAAPLQLHAAGEVHW